MTTLHIVRTSAFNSNDLFQCLALANPLDTIVLIDDGCYNMNHPLIARVLEEKPALAIKIMLAHAKARSINLINGIDAIIMQDLVELTLSSRQVITWQ